MASRHNAGASGLVVKFNVAIVEPPVRFRACALTFCPLNFFIFNYILVLPFSSTATSLRQAVIGK